MINSNEKYCKDCGKVIHLNAEICPSCGVRQMAAPQVPALVTSEVNPDWIVTLVLCFFGGFLGLHNFYNRKIGYGIFQILSFGGLGIWVLVDLIMIVTSTFKNKEGEYIKLNK